VINVCCGQNIIQNSGFESGTTTNWTEIGTASSITRSSTYQYSGSYSCRFTNPTSSYSARGVQSDFINVTAGEYYDLSGWFYVDNEGSGVISDTDFRLRIFWFQSDQTTACDPSYNPSSTEWSIDSFDTWSKKELTDLQAPSNAAYAYVLVECKESSNNDNDAYIDDISLIPSVSISGTSGFRMMSSPVAGQIYSDLLSELWTQGMTSADVTTGDANVWTYDGSSWSALSDITGSGDGASLTAGQGFLVYVFANTDNSGGDDLPVTLSVSGTENSGDIRYPSGSSTIDADQFGLAGNPYASTIDWDLVSKTNVTNSCYVWDDATSAYKTGNGSSGTLTDALIAPYQGFWVKASGSGGGYITIQEADKSSTAGTFYKTMNDSTGSMVFSIASGDYSGETYVSFMTNGEEGIDNSDAYKLLPMTATDRLVGLSYAESNGLDINNLPYISENSINIPLDIMYLTVDDNYNFVTNEHDVTMSWDISSVPETVTSLTLTDNTSGSSVNLDEQSEVTFTTVEKGSFPAYGSGGVNIYPEVGESRFTLTVAYGSAGVVDEPVPTEFALYSAYPNPFNPSTMISFDVPELQNVSVQIFNITGQLIETLINGNIESGKHKVLWDAGNLPSGIYFVQLKSGDKTITQKLTLLK